MEKPEQQDAHKNSSYFLASIINSSNDCIEALSLEGIVLFWNKSSEQLYGYSSQEIIGKSILIVSPRRSSG
jgi:PAS domain S-box-containing protein